jgi:hypothetical protein
MNEALRDQSKAVLLSHFWRHLAPLRSTPTPADLFSLHTPLQNSNFKLASSETRSIDQNSNLCQPAAGLSRSKKSWPKGQWGFGSMLIMHDKYIHLWNAVSR